MTYMTPLKDVPILLIDVADFTAKYPGVERKRALLRHLQGMLTDCARFFMPYGDVWAKWRRHGTYACLLALRQEPGAIPALEECLEAGTIAVDHVRRDSDWDAVRSDPEFEDLLRRFDPRGSRET